MTIVMELNKMSKKNPGKEK